MLRLLGSCLSAWVLAVTIGSLDAVFFFFFLGGGSRVFLRFCRVFFLMGFKGFSIGFKAFSMVLMIGWSGFL